MADMGVSEAEGSVVALAVVDLEVEGSVVAGDSEASAGEDQAVVALEESGDIK